MPSTTTLSFKPQHPLFVAEVEGVDWTKPLPASVCEEIRDGINKYGVLIFRNANINDQQQLAFAKYFGNLEPPPTKHMKNVKMRLEESARELFDLSNIDGDNEIVKLTNKRGMNMMRGNEIWHADMQYHPHRTLYSILRAVEIPPKEVGGETQYCDSRSAYEDLNPEMKKWLEGRVVNCSLLHNRRLGAPEMFRGIDPFDWPTSRWKAVYPHEGSGRTNLYFTSYAYSFDGMTPEESAPIIKKILDHMTQPKYVATVYWEQAGDMVMWDNTAVLHRATDSATYITKYRRDIRRASVYDNGKYGWGENDPNDNWVVKLPDDPFAEPPALGKA
jgi:alpha-ketoglutarate-dependent 2,4-dichlorophenoxyacetate dioxygenase